MMDERYYICDKENTEIVYGYIDYNKVRGFKIKPQNTIPYDGIEVSRLILVKPQLIEKVLKRKIKHKLNTYLAFLFTIIDSEDDDPDALQLFIDDVVRYKNIIINKYAKFLDKKYIKTLLRKVNIVESELKQKLNQLTKQNIKSQGKSR